jgi:antirestriction factor ArdC-like protein
MASTATRKRTTRKGTKSPAAREAASAQRKQKISDLMAALELWEAQADPDTVEAAEARLAHLTYSSGNIMLIIMQRPSASDVAGFKAWQDRGRHVRPGAKGIAILAPAGNTKKREDGEQGSTSDSQASETPAAAEPPAGDSSETAQARVKPNRFRITYVWDIRQTMPTAEWEQLMAEQAAFKAAGRAALVAEAIADGVDPADAAAMHDYEMALGGDPDL